MGPDVGSEGKEVASVEALKGMEDKNATQDKKDNPLQSSSNCLERISNIEALSDKQTITLDESEDVELDIIGYADNCDGGPKIECNVSTEYSSSFGDTLSGTDCGTLLGDEEVESQLYGGNGLDPVSYGYGEAFSRRKKKLTVHWRNFISPLMWRCRWVELQIKKLQSQTLKYDRELALCEQRKQPGFESFSRDGFDVKSLGFSSHTQRCRAMKRKKRKRIEETTDITSYMAQHSLFSYYEKKRSLADDMSLDVNLLKLDKTNNRPDDIDDFGARTTDGWVSSMLGDNDSKLENIFLKIEAAQSKLHKLKDRIDKVVNENPTKFSSINELDFLTSSGDPTFPDDGNCMLVRSLHEASQHMAEDEYGDVLMPDTAVNGHGEVVLLPEMIESTDKLPVGLSCGRAGKVLLQNCAVKEELIFSEEVKCKFIEQPQILEEQKPISQTAVSQADSTPKNTEPNAQPEVKSHPTVKSNLSKKGRKPRRRKSGSSKRGRGATG